MRALVVEDEATLRDTLRSRLGEAGFTVENDSWDLPTAFRARAGSGPLHISICAEYDCLPGIGHACGERKTGNARAERTLLCGQRQRP